METRQYTSLSWVLPTVSDSNFISSAALGLTNKTGVVSRRKKIKQKDIIKKNAGEKDRWKRVKRKMIPKKEI